MISSVSSYLRIWWITTSWEAGWPLCRCGTWLLRTSEVPSCSPHKPELSSCLFTGHVSLQLQGDCSCSLSAHTTLPVANSWETTQLGSLLCVQRDCSCSPLEVCLPQTPSRTPKARSQAGSAGVCADPGSAVHCGNYLHTSLFVRLRLQVGGGAQHLVWWRIIRQLVFFPRKSCKNHCINYS